MTRALVVGRRRKGRHIGRTVREVGAALQAAGWSVEQVMVDERADLRRAARRAVRRGCKVVVAVGGDGTVNEVVGALATTRIALGIIPRGTGNLLAGNLGIPSDQDGAVHTILAGVHRRIDLGRATVDGARHVMAVACGIGFDADVMEATRNRTKRRWGKLAYAAGVLTARGRIGNERHHLVLDGEPVETTAAEVLIANFGRMGAGLAPHRPVLADDGMLEVVVVRASGPLAALGAAWEALRQGDLGRSDGGHVDRTLARDVTVTTDRPLPVEIDGNVVGHTPVRVVIMPGALTVLVPRSDG